MEKKIAFCIHCNSTIASAELPSNDYNVAKQKDDILEKVAGDHMRETCRDLSDGSRTCHSVKVVPSDVALQWQHG